MFRPPIPFSRSHPQRRNPADQMRRPARQRLRATLDRHLLRAAPGPAAPGRVPLGFPDAESFARFGRQLYAGLQAAGFPDGHAALRGSAATGENFRTHVPFDIGRVSDLDVALASPSLFQRAKDLGIELRSGGYRTRPLKGSDLERLGLLDLRQILGR